MEEDLWYEETLKKLQNIAEENENILTLSLYGSLSKSDVKKDRWSDIDALIIIKDGSLNQFYPTTDWLKPVGEIFTTNQVSTDNSSATLKVYFTDFQRMDLIFVEESAIKKPDAKWTKQRFVFSRSDEIKKLLEEKPLEIIYPEESPYEFEELVNEFWYEAVVATTKVLRYDLLVSLHLGLELYRKCLELGMWLRDREVGTHVHRTGGTRNELPSNMNIQLEGATKEDILSLIEQCGREFDKLSLEWSAESNKHFPIFEKLLRMAREDLKN